MRQVADQTLAQLFLFLLAPAAVAKLVDHGIERLLKQANLISPAGMDLHRKPIFAGSMHGRFERKQPSSDVPEE
ncbi:hypothetical protein D3C87_1907780 [compost metagenome]